MNIECFHFSHALRERLKEKKNIHYEVGLVVI
ncbi:hypothetical protein BMS3Bbin15_00979 [archaeon BMS3Bbin15]|nr:hypothetical protein BMS3Bbin15_00979 [archaeon BMS3Bbin15]